MGLADIPAVSFEDDLTGLYNRRFLQRYLSTQIDWSAPQTALVSFILVDIDEFHRANDLYGHAEGDFVLQSFAERLKKSFRADDVIARDGGDSFFVICPNTPKEKAAELATQLVEDLGRNQLRTRRDRFPVELTASAGVVSFPGDGTDADAIRDAADKVLFHAKRTGRNRVSVGGKIDEQLAAERDVFAGLPCRTFCGRQPELNAALGSLEDLRQGRPSVLFVQGPAGIGKSRFLREIADVATARDLLYLYAICNESQRQSIGYSLIYLVDQYYRLNPDAQQDLHDCLFPAQRRMARQLISTLSSWREEDVEISPRDRKPLLLGMLETAILAMARRSPILILLDNARHCDRGTLDVLQRILRDRRAPVAVFFALKGDIRNIDPKADPGLYTLVEELQRSEGMQVLTLAPLVRDDVNTMVQSVLPEAGSVREFAELLYQKSEGNPLYVEEAIRALILRERITRQGQKYSIPKLEPDELPASLDAIIEQVLATLSPEAGEIVTNASIIGSKFDIQVLQEVMGKREGETLDAVDQVESTKIIEHLDRGTVDDYAFRSTTARDVRYVSAATDAKQLMHKRLAHVARSQSIRNPDRARAERSFHIVASGAPVPPSDENEATDAARPLSSVSSSAIIGRQPRIPEATAALSPESHQRALDFMRTLSALLRIGRLYPQWSQTGAQFTKQLQEAAKALVDEAGAVTFGSDARGITLNSRLADARAGDVLSEFGSLLSDRLVASMTFARGLDSRELDTLVSALGAPLNRSRAPSDHWDQFLDREEIKHVDILQRRYVAREAERGTAARRPQVVERTLNPDELDALRDALRHFKMASDNLRLYPPGHALVEEGLRETVRSLTDLAGRLKVISLACSAEGLLVNGHPTDPRTIGDAGAHLSAQLDKRELKSLTLYEGLRPDEIQVLVSIFAVPAEDPGWMDVFKTIVSGNEIRNFEFGGLLYTQLASASGGVVPTSVVATDAPAAAGKRTTRTETSPSGATSAQRSTGSGPGASEMTSAYGGREVIVRAGGGGSAPAGPEGADAGTDEPVDESAYGGITIRADVRARAYLKAGPDKYLSEDFEHEFGPLLEVLNFGWTAQLGMQLVERLAELARDPSPQFRERALRVMATGLSETSSAEARGPLVTRACEVLGHIVTGEIEGSVLRVAADVIPPCIAAAFVLGRFDAVADLLQRVRKRIDTKTAPPEFKSKISAKLLEMAGPEGPMAGAIRAVATPIRESALRISGMFGPPLVPVLVEFIAESDDAAHRKLATAALKEIGGNAAAELIKLVTFDGPVERVARVLSVLETCGPGSLAGAVAAAVDHADAGVRAAAFAMVKRADKPLAAGGLRKLTASERPEIALAAIGLAAELGLQDLGLDITRIAQSSNDEAVVRACCDYFGRVKVPASVPALRRIFDARARMFGLVKGFSDETRAMAVKAAAALTHQDATDLVESAKQDRSPDVRRAAGVQ